MDIVSDGLANRRRFRCLNVASRSVEADPLKLVKRAAQVWNVGAVDRRMQRLGCCLSVVSPALGGGLFLAPLSAF